MRRFNRQRTNLKWLPAFLARSVFILVLCLSFQSCGQKEPELKIDPGVRFFKEGDSFTAPWDGVALRTDIHDKLIHD